LICVRETISLSQTELSSPLLAFKLSLVHILSESLTVAFAVLLLKELLLRRWLCVGGKDCGLSRIMNYYARVYVCSAYNI